MQACVYDGSGPHVPLLGAVRFDLEEGRAGGRVRLDGRPAFLHCIRPMKITSGLFTNIVLQRNRRGVSEARFEGTCRTIGEVVATVSQSGRSLKAFRGVTVGVAARGKFKGCLRGLPVGGPYEIELCVGDDRLNVRHVLVGDVWILGGQSNMEGIGHIKDRAKPEPMVRAFYMHDAWKTAKDPIHNLCDAVDPVHADLCGGVLPQRAAYVGVGPGVAFGQNMFRRTGVPQGLIACAHGGTSMEQWDPAKKREGGRSLYGAMMRRFRKNGSSVAGVIWYQGCSDANEAVVALYQKRMKRLIVAMRHDFKSPQLPFVLVQISRVMGPGWDHDSWSVVREVQRRLPERIQRCAVVPAIDLELDDGIHISGKEQNRLGRRLAQAMCAVRGDRNAGKLPIRLKSVRCEPDRTTGLGNVSVTFDRVMGGLRAMGRPWGFDLLGPDGPTHGIFRTDMAGNSVVLKTGVDPVEVASMMLFYGYGTAPYCNLVDAADRAVPAFGPVPIGKGLAVSPFVQRFHVSRALPSAGDLSALKHPPDRKKLRCVAREFPLGFCDVHADLFAGPDDKLVYYACPIRCEEPMRLKVCLGYDGPVKVWIDGKACYHDPAGTNPATPDKAKISFVAKAGTHEMVVALGSNHGRAWGIFLRFLRTDVPARLMRQGPDAYRMPEIL